MKIKKDSTYMKKEFSIIASPAWPLFYDRGAILF